jgi:hypothetical protein
MRLQTNQRMQLNLPTTVFQSSQKHIAAGGGSAWGGFGGFGAQNTVKTLESYIPEMQFKAKSNANTSTTPIGLQPVNPLLRESHARTRRKALALAVLKYAKKCMYGYILHACFYREHD